MTDDEKTETHTTPSGGTETTKTSHSESTEGAIEISKNVTEETVTGDEANEI